MPFDDSRPPAILYVILGAPFIVVFIALSYLINGWALMHLWRWFVVPFGLPVITIPQAIGLMLVKYLITYTVNPKSEKTEKKKQAVFQAFCIQLLYPILLVGVGYIVHLYV